MKKQLLLEKISKEEMVQHIKDYYAYAKNFLDIDKKPKIIFNYDDSNANDFLGKTGYYDPKKMEIHLYVNDRHPKDIVRSFAHELIHHYQNLNEKLPDDVMSNTKDVDYASKDKHLRDMEREAFEKGNMMFRDWTDSLKAKRGKKMDEVKKMKKKKFPKKMSMKQAAEKGVSPDADRNNNGSIEGWEAGIDAAISSKTKERKMKESQELQETDPRLEKVLTKEERIMDDHKTNREQIIYNELMRRFLKQGK